MKKNIHHNRKMTIALVGSAIFFICAVGFFFVYTGHKSTVLHDTATTTPVVQTELPICK